MNRTSNPYANMFSTIGEMKSGYDAARQSRLRRRRDLPASGASGDWHIRTESDWLRVLEFSRDLDRNDCILGSVLDRFVVNTIQDGANLDFDTGSIALDEELLGYHQEWATSAENCDASGEMTFGEMQGHVLRQSAGDGDLWAYLNDVDTIQLWEAHRLRTPSRTSKPIVHGVQLNGLRRREKVYVTKDDLSPMAAAPLLRDMDVFDVRDEDGLRRCLQMFVGLKSRATLTRPLSIYAKLFDMASMHDDVQFAAILKQQLQNALVFVEKKSEFDTGGPDEPLGERSTESRPDGSTEVIEGIGPGTVVKARKGRDLVPFMATAGGADLIRHVRMILQILGVNLGMPLVLVLMDASETNFSGWRGAYDQAKMGFRMNQFRLRNRFLDPVLMWRLAALAKQKSSIRVQLDKLMTKYRATGVPWYTWHMPTWPYVDPLQDATADFFTVANHMEAPSTMMGRKGMNYDREMARGIEDRASAIKLAIQTAAKLNAEFSQETAENKVRWQHLYEPLQPKHVSMSVSAQLDPPQQAKPGQNGSSGASQGGNSQ